MENDKFEDSCTRCEPGALTTRQAVCSLGRQTSRMRHLATAIREKGAISEVGLQELEQLNAVERNGGVGGPIR